MCLLSFACSHSQFAVCSSQFAARSCPAAGRARPHDSSARLELCPERRGKQVAAESTNSQSRKLADSQPNQAAFKFSFFSVVAAQQVAARMAAGRTEVAS